jgi:lipopolysaccharide/colanic/teichoic acid biosynthesis glycosyltransferase
MNYSIRRLLEFWIGPSVRPGPERVELDEHSAAESSNHSAAGGSRSPIVDPAIPADNAAPARWCPAAVKRAFDIIVAIMGLVVLSPTFALVSMAIKIDSRGPVFRRRRLYDHTGKVILVWNFRFNEFTPRAISSPRATRIGRILYSSGVEELPQLINVLGGEMSIVGPEPFLTLPDTVLHDQSLIQLRQHKMKPGLIGWAQVNGCGGDLRNREAIRRRVAYDIYYIENWSFSLDMKIIAMGVFSRNA